MDERNVKQCRRKICDNQYTTVVEVLSSFDVARYNDATFDDTVVEVLSSFDVARYNDATFDDLKSKHLFIHTPSLPYIPIDNHQLIAYIIFVLDMIKSFHRGTSCGRDKLCAQHLMECLSGAVVAIPKELVAFITQLVNLFLYGKSPKMLDEYIASAPLTPLIKPNGGIRPIVVCTIWRRLVSKYLDDGTIIRDTLVVGKVLESIMKDGPCCGLHLNVYKTEVLLPKEDPISRLVCVFPPNIARTLHGVKLLGGPASVEFDFSSELVMERVTKTIELVDIISKINDPRSELLLLRACVERIVTAFGPRFGDWQWRLATLPFAFEGLGISTACDVLNYTFLASRLMSATLQTKVLRHSGGPTFNDALCTFNAKWRLIYVCVLLFSLPKPYATCFRIFSGNIYRDNVVSCDDIISIKHWYNVIHDSLVDFHFPFGISAGKEVDMRLNGWCGKPLRSTDMFLYSWDKGLDACVDLIGSPPLTQTGMVNFVLGHAVIEAAQRKCVKYEAKCAYSGYGFLPFSFFSFGDLRRMR
ncbi:hypothetical protein Tco_1325811 [Tanacetum coccineum]